MGSSHGITIIHIKKMKKIYTFGLALLFAGTVMQKPAQAQGTGFVKQVISVNSGKFEFAPPFTDFVTMQQYDPASQATTPRGTVFTQSAQDLVIHGHFGYMAAQDSIVKINLNTWERVASAADSGLGKLALFNDRLVVSKQYPVVKWFVEILDTADLSLVSRIDGIPGECSGIVCSGDSVYVAVNGGWSGTEGKLAVIDPAGWNLSRVVDLGPGAIGIANLYLHNGMVYAVNKTPYGAPDTGSITVYTPASGQFQNILIPVKTGNGAGISQNTLFLGMNDGLGAFDLSTLQVADPAVVPDPGSAMFLYITSAAVDSLTNRLYVNIGDYVSDGFCLVTTLQGDSLTSYSTGISTEVIAVDYRPWPLGTGPVQVSQSLAVYPNPAVDRIHIHPGKITSASKLTLINSNGQVLLSREIHPGEDITVPVNHLVPGIYLVNIVNGTDVSSARFVKK
jgi:hypothetical protein